MNALSIFEKITGLRRKREEQSDQQYSDIVASLVAGTEPDPEEVERILSDAGKSVDKLKADVQKGQERMAMHAMANALPKLQKDRKQILKDIDKLDAEFEKLEDQHDESRRPLVHQLKQCDEAIRDAEKAKSQLVETCEDPVLLAEMEHLQSEIRQLIDADRDLFSKANFLEDKAETERLRADREISISDRDHKFEQSESYLEQAKSCRKRIDENKKLREKLEQQRDDLEKRMREV